MVAIGSESDSHSSQDSMSGRNTRSLNHGNIRTGIRPNGGFRPSVSEDWQLHFSTYLGDYGEQYFVDVAIDAEGNVYAAINLLYSDFAFTYSFTTPQEDNQYIVIAKFYPNGTAAYVNLIAEGLPIAISLDSNGDIYVAGSTTSSEFPVTPDAFQTEKPAMVDSCCFILHLSNNGTKILHATYITGTDGHSEIDDIWLDQWNNVYATGSHGATDFPVSGTAYQTTYSGQNDAFALKMSPDLTTFLGGTYYGGPYPDVGHGICLDQAGNVYIAGAQKPAGLYSGDDALIVKFTPTFTNVMWSDVIGDGGQNTDRFNGIAIDPEGYVVAVGMISTDGFAVNAAFSSSLVGASDFLIAEYTLVGTKTMLSYLGTESYEWLEGVEISGGYRYFVGYSSGSSFPLKDSYSAEMNGGQDIILLKTDADFGLVYSCNVGGRSSDIGTSIAVGNDGLIAVGGTTLGHGFPLLNPYQSEVSTGDLPYPDACILLLTEPSLDTSTTGTTSTDTLTTVTSSTGNTLTGDTNATSRGGEVGFIPLILENLPIIVTLGSICIILGVVVLTVKKRP